MLALAVRAVVAAAAVIAAACAAPGSTAAPSRTPDVGSTAGPTQTVRGVLLDVVSPGIQTLEGFTLRTDDGRDLQFVPAPEFNVGVAHVMSPGHMRQHMALADPVVVTYRDVNGTLVALSATDANAQ